MGSSVNTTNYKVDQSVRIFDSFYGFDANVPANEYDIVNSFFKIQMQNDRAANNMTATLFQVAGRTKIPVLSLLDNMKGKTGVELSINLAYYFNGIRSSSTLLGVNAHATPNFYAARAVVQ